MLKVISLSSCILSLLLVVACQNVNQPSAKSAQAVAQRINSVLVEARNGLEQLSEKAELFYSNRSAFTPRPMADYYKYYEGTAYYKDADDGLCGMWASGFKPIGKKEQEEIQFWEGFQPDIKEYVLSYDVVELAHMLTTDHVGIFFPFFNGVSYFEPQIDFYEAFMPFYNVAPEKNPDKETRWIEPYIDAAGNGYVCTVSTPIYNDDTFVASIGADIPLLPLGEKYLDQSKMQMLVTNESTLIFATQALLNELPVKALDKHYYTKHVVIDEFASDEFKLKNNPSSDIKNLAELINNDEKFGVGINGHEYSVEVARIGESSWRVVEIVKD